MLTRDPKFLSLLEDFKSQLRTEYGFPLNPSLGKVFDQLKATLPEKVPLSKSSYLLDLPKWFGDIYEAVFGAIWLDQNQSLSKFWEIAGPQLKPLMRFESHRKEERFKSLNPRKFLDEKAEKFKADEPQKLTSEGLGKRWADCQGIFKKIFELLAFLPFTQRSNARVFQIACRRKSCSFRKIRRQS